jgi:hypothetical protein
MFHRLLVEADQEHNVLLPTPRVLAFGCARGPSQAPSSRSALRADAGGDTLYGHSQVVQVGGGSAGPKRRGKHGKH